MPPKRKFADIEPEPPAVPPSLPPSVEEAYRRKCVQLKNRTNEVEDANDAARLRLARIKRQVEKLRIERAFLLEQLSKRTSTNVEDSEGSPSPPPTVSSLCRCSFFLLASPSRWNHRYLRANGLGDRQYNHLRVSSNEYLTPLLTRPFSPRISHYVSNAATENPPFSTSTPKALQIAPSKNPHLLQNPKPDTEALIRTRHPQTALANPPRPPRAPLSSTAPTHDLSSKRRVRRAMATLTRMVTAI